LQFADTFDDFAKSIYQINERIGKLQALEYTQ
jgi:hypothetical protein